MHTSHSQRGVVLFISLIVLLLLALGGIALSRSVNTANVIAGNISFKQGALAATDLGMKTAMALFDASNSGYLATESQTYSNNATYCYSATAFTKDGGTHATRIDPRGIPNILLDKSTFDSSYSGCKFTNSSTKETVRYLIDRQCSSDVSGQMASEASCNVYSVSSISGSSSDNQTGSESVPLYRVTVRVDGPRQTVSFAQAIIHP